MAFNFPSGATNGQQYTADNGVVYVFDGTKWNIQSAINNYAITGSNTFTGSQYITGSVEVYSDNWPEIRLINGDTGIQYHLQNTAGGNFSIHNDTIGASTLRIDSASSQGDSHVHIFGDLYVQSGSIFSISGSHGYIRALNLISGNIEGIGNVHLYSESVQNKIEGLATTGSNTFSGSQIFTSSLFDLYNDNWTELRLTNGSTGISYHLQNTAGGNFTIHNDAIGLSTLRIDSGSTQSESHVHIFGDLYVQSGSIFSISGSHGYVRALSMVETPKIIGTGSITIQPDPNDTRNVQIYNTAPSDIHIKGDATYTFFGDDTNFLKIDNINSTITIDSTNGLFIDTPVEINGSLNVSGGDITGSIAATNGVVSGSSQLTSSYDLRYTLSGSVQPLPDGLVSGSSQIDIESTNGFTSYSSSVDGRIIYEKERIDAILSGSTIDYDTLKEIVDLINLGTGSYETVGRGIISSSAQLPSGLISGSSQLTASYDERYTLSGSITQTTWENISGKPDGLVSQSTDLSLLNSFTQSIDSRVDSLESLTGSYATTGSNNFNGNQIITGSLTVSGSSTFTNIGPSILDGNVNVSNNLIVTGSSMFGSGSFNIIAPEKFLVIQDDPENYNIIVAEANTDNYSQVVVWNKNSGISASSDIIAQADNGLETNMYADLGINSSNFTGNGNGIGAANDAYVYGKAKDFWVGNLTTQSLYLFANEEGIPDAILSNTVFTFSGSIVANGGVTGGLDYSNLTNVPSLVSTSQQISDFGFITSSQTIDTGSLLTTSSYQSDSSSFDNRINNLITAGVPAGTISGSAQITSFGFISESVDLTSLNNFTASISTASLVESINNLTSQTSSYETIGRGIISESVVTISETQPSTGIGNLWYDSNGGNLYLHYDTNTWIDTSNGVIQTIINDGSLLSTASFNEWTASYTASTPAGTISSSNQISSLGFVSGSYETTGRGIVSGSSQLTASYDLRYTLSGSVGGGVSSWNDLTDIPNGLVSNSIQLTNSFEEIASGTHTLVSSSVQILGGSGIYSSSQQLPSGLVSGSSQVLGGSGILSGSISYTSLTNIPSGIVSGSSQITSLLPNGVISGSSQVLGGSGIWSGSSQLPSGLVSGSSQLTGSFETTGRGIISSSTQLDGLGYTSLSGNNTFTGTNVFSGSTFFSGSVIFEETREVIVLESNFGAGTKNFDFNSGSTFYINGLTGTGTWNVQNFVSSSQRVTPITFVVEQGATAYSASAYQLGGTTVTVKWQNGATPIGSANKTDVFALSVFRSGSTFNVLGSYSTFG